MPKIRVLNSTNRSMQRLGFLKRLARRVTSVSSSNLSNLGHSLISSVTKKVRIPLTQERAMYIKLRLTDRVYSDLKRKANDWLDGRADDAESIAAMELQDLYLADVMMPSQTGKLVEGDWRHYTPLGVALGLVRAGTYSATTRTFSLLYLTTGEELQAFMDYDAENNPLYLSIKQKLLLLYSLLEFDGEVVIPLWACLESSQNERFSDRDAGDLLPNIFRDIDDRHRRSRMISADERERLQNLVSSADSIARWTDAVGYPGGGAREHHARPRVEPYADISILSKPDPTRYEYQFTEIGHEFVAQLTKISTTDQVDYFLSHDFFSAAAAAWRIQSQNLDEQDEIVIRLFKAWGAIHSPGGYAPIREISLLAGIEALTDDGLIFEGERARQAIIAYQKANPYKVRFTVNRLGVLAHARFLEAP